jgi:hypothetical protein
MTLIINLKEPIAIVTWDWKEQPSWGAISSAMEHVSFLASGKISFYSVDTGSDDYAVVITGQHNQPENDTKAEEIYDQAWDEENGFAIQ